MPTFDFSCTKCKKVFEFARPFGSKKMPVCPKCKNKKVEKLFTPPGIQFKGKGFYKTDSEKSHEKKMEKPKVEAPQSDSTSKESVKS